MLAAAVPIAPPVNPPVTTGTDQVYVVPDGTTPLVPFAGVAVKLPALHEVAVILVIAGVGFTVTVKVLSVFIAQSFPALTEIIPPDIPAVTDIDELPCPLLIIHPVGTVQK